MKMRELSTVSMTAQLRLMFALETDRSLPVLSAKARARAGGIRRILYKWAAGQ